VDVVGKVGRAAGFDGPGADGGVKSDTGSSTWAGCVYEIPKNLDLLQHSLLSQLYEGRVRIVFAV